MFARGLTDAAAMPAIPELRKQKQEDSKFEDSLGYTKKSFLKMK